MTIGFIEFCKFNKLNVFVMAGLFMFPNKVDIIIYVIIHNNGITGSYVLLVPHPISPTFLLSRGSSVRPFIHPPLLAV